MAVFYDIFSDAEKPRAVEKLIDLIHNENDSFDCGILGLRVIFYVLSAYGRTDIAYRMITKEEFPSYGYEIAHGATSVWEDFRRVDDAPISRNHHFFCDYISWFIEEPDRSECQPLQKKPQRIPPRAEIHRRPRPRRSHLQRPCRRSQNQLETRRRRHPLLCNPPPKARKPKSPSKQAGSSTTDSRTRDSRGRQNSESFPRAKKTNTAMCK